MRRQRDVVLGAGGVVVVEDSLLVVERVPRLDLEMDL
jgi:hypothetical protein